jgi:hypothetical protein
VFGIDGIYSDDDDSLNPSRQYLISNAYREKHRNHVSPALGDFSNAQRFEQDDDFAPPPQQRAPPPRIDETPIDIFSLGEQPTHVCDAVKVLLTILLFVIASCYFHAFVLYNDRNKEWLFYLKIAVATTLVFIATIWATDISLGQIYS